MTIERLLQVFTATLAALGTLLLGMGQREVAMPLAVMMAAMASVWLTDITGWFRLNRYVAAAVGTIASIVAFREAMPLNDVVSVLAIGQLLVYLQILLLFLRKDVRVYWQLIVLSLLQVVVAAVFSQGVAFGLLMVVYFFVALTTLALLFLHAEAQRFGDGSDLAPLERLPDRRWPLAAQAAVMMGDGHGARLRRQALGRELFGRVAMMGLGTLALTAVAFFTFPRLGRPAWRSVLAPVQQVVGYSGDVELGELGRIIESPEEVMRVVLTDPATGKPYQVDGGVYLQGTILTQYENRHWTCPGERHQRLERLLLPIDPQPSGVVVEQRITIEPMNRRELFAIKPYFVSEASTDIHEMPERERLLRDNALRDRRFTYALLTTGLLRGRQDTLTPCMEPPNLDALRYVPTESVPSLPALAKRWADEPGLASERRYAKAKHLEIRLRDSEQFSYSLESQPRDYQLDPIEDFIVNNPRGHCEYFSTTLALALRAQGIPSRVVVGYHCDEFNPLGGFFQVRQLHAHTWVEAYLAPDDLPADRVGPEWQHGGWLRLDATPSDDDRAGTAQTLLAPVVKSFDWLEYIWDNYIMEMDRSRQNQAIYEPLVRWAKDTYQRLRNPEWWRSLGRAVFRAIDPRQWQVNQWFNWRGGLIASLLALLVIVTARGAWRLARRIRSLWGTGKRSTGRASRVEVEFYRRLNALLARHGIQRSPGQTQREFAHSAGNQLAQRWSDPAVAALPGEVVDAFYHVRFGRLPLDNAHHDAVEQALVQLDRPEPPPSGF